MKTTTETLKKVKVRINRRNLTGLINRETFNTSGMFVPYQFIAMDFEVEKNNTARFYKSTQPSSNSWTNYPGLKIWSSNSARNRKEDVLQECEIGVKQAIDEYISMEQQYGREVNIEFEFVDFD